MKFPGARAKRKLREWFIRYAPAEAAGTATALTGYWVMYWTTSNLALAALAAALCENVGYYTMAIGRETVRYWRLYGHRSRAPRLWLACVHSLRDALVEFGPAEILDSLMVRPGLFYLLPHTFAGHHGIAVVLAKFVADAVFYLLAIISHELSKRVFAKRVVCADAEDAG